MTRAESTAPRLPKQGAIGHKPLMTPPIQIAEATLDLPDLDAVTRLGAAIAAHLEAGDVVALRGDLGAGKTTLARAVLLARGHEGETPSPTFTLVQAYALPGLEVAHFDLYRLKHPDEVEELGFYDAIAQGAALIEWPEQAEEHMPAERLDVMLGAEPTRRARLIGHGRWAALAAAIAEAAR